MRVDDRPERPTIPHRLALTQVFTPTDAAAAVTRKFKLNDVNDLDPETGFVPFTGC